MPLHWRKARSWRGSLFPETLSQGSHIQPLHQLPVRDDQKGGAKPEHKGHARKEHGPDVPGKEDRLKRRVEMPRGDGQRKVLQRVGHTVDVKNEPGQDDGGQKAEVSAAVPRNRMELISSRFEKSLYPKDFFGLPSDAVIEELYFYFINADGSIVVKDDENGGQEFFVEQSDE